MPCCQVSLSTTTVHVIVCKQCFQTQHAFQRQGMGQRTCASSSARRRPCSSATCRCPNALNASATGLALAITAPCTQSTTLCSDTCGRAFRTSQGAASASQAALPCQCAVNAVTLAHQQIAVLNRICILEAHSGLNKILAFPAASLGMIRRYAQEHLRSRAEGAGRFASHPQACGHLGSTHIRPIHHLSCKPNCATRHMLAAKETT